VTIIGTPIRSCGETFAAHNIFEELADEPPSCAIAAAGRTLRSAGQRSQSISAHIPSPSKLVREKRDTLAIDEAPRREIRAMAHARQVVELPDLRFAWRSRQEERHRATCGAIIANLDAFLAAVLQQGLRLTGAGIDGVLDQLLDDRRRPLDHFAGRDLIHELGGENLDAGHL